MYVFENYFRGFWSVTDRNGKVGVFSWRHIFTPNAHDVAISDVLPAFCWRDGPSDHDFGHVSDQKWLPFCVQAGHQIAGHAFWPIRSHAGPPSDHAGHHAGHQITRRRAIRSPAKTSASRSASFGQAEEQTSAHRTRKFGRPNFWT